MKTVEYRVRPVTRYIVTKYEEGDNGASCGEAGEFASEVLARNAALAFVHQETVMAQPADKVIGHDGVFWDRQSGRWSNDPALADDGSPGFTI
ncbi:MAG: hypothetical protein ACR2RE_06760 [Geminicoccaceae bacterium]